MKILLDTHMLGQKEAGNERYWKNLSGAFSKNKNGNEFYNYGQSSRNGLFSSNRQYRARPLFQDLS